MAGNPGENEIIGLVSKVGKDSMRIDAVWPVISNRIRAIPEYVELWRSGEVENVVFPQCAVGLETPEHDLPILKLTELWTNAPELIYDFHDVVCTHDQHGTMCGRYRGQQRSRLAQIWPPRMCRMIVEGICCLIRKHRRVGYDYTFLYLPVEVQTGKAKRGRPRIYPESAHFDCPACKCSRPWSDPRHTRNSEPPLLCKH